MLQVQHDDGLPQNICLNCVSQINISYTFRNVCKQNDVILRETLGNVHKFKYIKDDVDDELNNESNNTETFTKESEAIENIKIETETVIIKKENESSSDMEGMIIQFL